jgi:hypothetical protein
MNTWRVKIGAALLSCLASQLLAAPLYRAVDLGFTNTANETIGFDLNAANVVVGVSWDPVFWTERAGTRPLPQPKAAAAVPFALNDGGTMAGTVSKNDKRRVAAFTSGMRPSFFLDGTWAADSLADYPVVDISNKGEVLGVSSSPWLWSEELGLRKVSGESRKVNRLNDSGHVVGFQRIEDFACHSMRAFIYDARSQVFTPLDGGPPDMDEPHCGHFSNATALNNNGQVVGYSNLGSGGEGDPVSGFIWSRSTGHRLLKPTDPRMVDIAPLDINDKGQVVGTFRYRDSGAWQLHSYFYWDAETGVVDLQALLDPLDPMSSDAVLWSNSWGARINDKGTIMVSGKLRSAPPPRLIRANRTFVLLAQP